MMKNLGRLQINPATQEGEVVSLQLTYLTVHKYEECFKQLDHIFDLPLGLHDIYHKDSQNLVDQMCAQDVHLMPRHEDDLLRKQIASTIISSSTLIKQKGCQIVIESECFKLIF